MLLFLSTENIYYKKMALFFGSYWSYELAYFILKTRSFLLSFSGLFLPV